MVALIVVVALLVALYAFGTYFAAFTARIPRQTLEHARAWQEEHYDLSWYDGLEKQDYTVESYDGYVLHAQLLKNPTPTRRYMLVSHGYTDNRFGALKYTRMYLDLGFNVIVYDLRGHGENEATFCTYSARESKDLLAMIEDSRARCADMTFFGIHGESLGAATSVAVLEYRPEIDFVVADCGFGNIRDVLAGAAKNRHTPAWFVDVASLCFKLRYGYSYGQMRPIDSLPGNQIPILFIHGAQDSFIPPSHSEAMSRATAGYSEVRLIEGAEHANSILTDPNRYGEYVAAFIERVEAGREG